MNIRQSKKNIYINIYNKIVINKKLNLIKYFLFIRSSDNITYLYIILKFIENKYKKQKKEKTIYKVHLHHY